MTDGLAEALAALGLVALGGCIGGITRFWVAGAIARRFGGTFPWGTMVVNVTGSAAIGMLGALLLTPASHEIRHLPAWAALVVGVLGSYTTVSSFSLQTVVMARNGMAGRAAANVILTIALCLSSTGVAYLATARFLALDIWR